MHVEMILFVANDVGYNVEWYVSEKPATTNPIIITNYPLMGEYRNFVACYHRRNGVAVSPHHRTKMSGLIWSVPMFPKGELEKPMVMCPVCLEFQWKSRVLFTSRN